MTDATVNSRCLGFVRAAVQVVAVLACGPAPAHEDAIGITADRMEVMKDMASHMSALQKMLDGRAAYDTAAARDHARALHEKCLEAAGQFPDHAHDPVGVVRLGGATERRRPAVRLDAAARPGRRRSGQPEHEGEDERDETDRPASHPPMMAQRYRPVA